MGEKPYIKPEIREESSILTVRAWATSSTIALQNATNPASEEIVNSESPVLQEWASDESASTIALLNAITRWF